MHKAKGKGIGEHGLKCEVQWPLGGITMNKASGGDGIPAEPLKILKGV